MDNSTRFQSNPVSLNRSRTKKPMPFTASTTFKAGELVPILNYELVQPGDTFKVSMSALIRSTTPVAPVMDDAYLDVFFFFCPHKILLNRESMSNTTGANAAAHSFKAWIGAQDSLLNVPYPTKSALPAAAFDADCRAVGTLGDHLGYPLGNQYIENLYVTPWSVLSYISVWNNYFRDPNTMNPLTMSVASDAYSPTGFKIVLNNYPLRAGDYMDCLYACRRHGYFGSALPFPQRVAEPVSLPLGTEASLIVKNDTGSLLQPGHLTAFGAGSGGSIPAGSNGSVGFIPGTSIGATTNANVRVDLSGALAATVDTVRYAFQLQNYYVRLARGGNRLSEMTKSVWNVTPHDYNDDTPEFLGGKSILLQNHLVANTSGGTYSTESQQSIGSTGAFSLTNDKDYYFTKSFDTWGTLLCVCVVRPRESFAQGLDRQFTKFDALDLYNPILAHIAEMGIKKGELYADGSDADNEIFGYQPAWSEYSYLPDKTTGYLRPGQNLSYWTYVNNFANHPTLLGYLRGDELYKNIDQTLQVKSPAAGLQYMAQFKFDITAIRVMPADCFPGLIDHA